MIRTLFADETVIAVVRVVGITQTSVRVLELEELVAMLARVSCAKKKGSCWYRSLYMPAAGQEAY